MKRILVGLDVPEERRVGLAAYMLVEKADFWWESMKKVYDIEVMTWEEFERIFLGKYFGEVAKHAKRMEFEYLIQGTMSVLEILRRPTKFGSKGGIEKGNKEWGKVPRGYLRARSRDRELSSLRGIPHSMQEVSRVLRGWLLIEYVMVVERETTYGGLGHCGVYRGLGHCGVYRGLAHCGVYSRLDLNIREVLSNSR
ncbi:hypothetical protein CK203_114633 [Vitis vinifera]|uniref:Retrotransposon gag domain-containing protein n=1 Tax=Vitis vinifera TaxID=29760 RepID=A0A438DCC3_VITVI|nr:hypothetical protein CK203_114633 [Vitis vinifera]